MLPKEEPVEKESTSKTLSAYEAKKLSDRTEIPGDYDANVIINDVNLKILHSIEYGGYSTSVYIKYKDAGSIEKVKQYYESEGYKVFIQNEYMKLNWANPPKVTIKNNSLFVNNARWIKNVNTY